MFSERHFTAGIDSVYNSVKWVLRDVCIKGSKGETIFEFKGAKVPENWSQTAVDVCVSKYFRKSGVKTVAKAANFDLETDVAEQHEEVSGPETSVWQVISRMVAAWAQFGRANGYLTDPEQVSIFMDEISYMILHQIAAPNSPQWFNTGLHTAYGITGGKSGHYYFDKKGEIHESPDSYSYPQISACFIQPVSDDLVNPGGIMDLWVREARLFKMGSGTGTNFSSIRSKGEKLANGGVSGGLMPYLKIGDVAAGTIKSGGTTRKAAKMVVVDVDHPEILDFIHWKMREELKVQAMVEGDSFHRDLARHGVLPPGATDGYEERAASVGLHLDYDFNGETYQTVSGQNSNNSVRVTNKFMQAVKDKDGFATTYRTTGKPAKCFKADYLWMEMARAAHACADPGIQFHDTINWWHTCSADGPIRASNPCSEYMFLDNTACNLASLNLIKFLKPVGANDDDDRLYFDVHAFKAACMMWTVVLDISVSMAQYPSKEICSGSRDYRTLGLGYTNLGATLMQLRIPYDSGTGRVFAKCVASLMTASAYQESGLLAFNLGAFPRYEHNKTQMKDVLRKHADSLRNTAVHNDAPLSRLNNLSVIHNEAVSMWGHARLRESYRNAQVTVIAPTGTISLVMDCDTTGIEPDFSLVKHKKLSGGGSMVLLNTVASSYICEKASNPVEALGGVKAGHDVSEYIDSKNVQDVLRCAMGKNPIPPLAHVEMMAAVQPGISGAISKTVNMPKDCTVEDVERIHRMAFSLGLKSIAIYRDGSKMSQPLNVKKDEEKVDVKEAPKSVVAEQTLKVGSSSVRRHLPKTRNSVTHKFNIGGHGGYFTIGLFEDGSPGEVFLRMNKAGSTIHGLCENFGRAISMALQYGVPTDRVVASFSHQKFEPSGVTDNPDIPMASSPIDYLFRWMGHRFTGDGRDGILPACGEGEGVSVGGFVDNGQGDTAPSKDEPVSPLGSRSVSEMSGPPCHRCGSVMVRAGACFKCNNCGEQGGCS